ncbi:hypothetical protein PAXRUDRAFT_828672 [Paxillus rubicundulus Ve08.2h10]|uniref:Uncharacterized protein n=1 Tax=Paxillus rubicundulus Ve08.2h10 TaxID=930991 RepID=A0A0D0DP71_9AGAM|nr:hypothetical protein PAXRUDRAFT_828672 [Paxillus rubicundulus Ve08.2h10]
MNIDNVTVTKVLLVVSETMLWVKQLKLVSQVARSSISLPSGIVHRHVSTKAQQNRQNARNDDSGDFRPRWVYSASSFLTYTTIPVALLYCVFLADWGDRDHVFMPLRRWMLQHKQSILSLSPEEVALVQRQSAPALRDSPSPGSAEGQPSS